MIHYDAYKRDSYSYVKIKAFKKQKQHKDCHDIKTCVQKTEATKQVWIKISYGPESSV